MKSRKIVLVSSIVASSLVIGASVFILNKNKSMINLLNANEIHPGTIVIDVNDANLHPEYGYIEVDSEAGNTFQFDLHGVTIKDGYFEMQESGSYLTNHQLLNGLTELRFFTPDSMQNINLGISLNYETSMDFEERKIAPSQDSISFTDYNPGRFYIETLTSEPFKFSKLIINYECVADTPSFTIKRLENHGQVNGYQVNTVDCLFIPVGNNLSTISLNGCYVYPESGKDFAISDSFVSNLSVAYKSSESTVGLEGSYPATLSFSYGGATYSSDEVYIVGYDHVSYTLEDFYLNDYEVLRQDTDSVIPDDFTLSTYGDLLFYNSSDVEIDHFDSNLSYVPITEAMIVESDSDRFTGMGQHKIKITYEGITNTFNYVIYDPTINNIRNLHFNGSLTLEEGASIQDFVTLVTGGEFYIDYYDIELAKELPIHVTLSQDNFDLTAGMFDHVGYIEVPVHYSTYNGTVTVHVILVKGNLVKTYTSEDGVSIFGDLIHEIAIYDNGTCAFDPGPNSEIFTYSIDGNVLTVHFYESVDLKFIIDDEKNTFEKYSSSGNLMYTFSANFHPAFEDAPDQYIYPAKVYDDYSIIFDMGGGMEVSVTFTIDPVVSEKIYFDFMGMPCYGMIDFDLLQLTVYAVE